MKEIKQDTNRWREIQRSLIFLVAMLVMSGSPPCWSKHGGEVMTVMMVMMETMVICCLPSAIAVPHHVQIKLQKSCNFYASDILQCNTIFPISVKGL